MKETKIVKFPKFLLKLIPNKSKLKKYYDGINF